MFDRARNIPSPAEAASRRGRLLLRRFRRAQDGVVIVEFAFVAIPFFALLLAIFETALMFWTNQVLEESLSQASRALVTGQSQYRYTAASPAANAAKFRDDVCNAAPMKLIDCDKLTVDVRTYASFADAKTETAGSNPLAGGALNTSGFTYTQPNRNDIVVVRAVLDYKLFLTSWASGALANIGQGRRGIVASMAFRAEPFSTGSGTSLNP